MLFFSEFWLVFYKAGVGMGMGMDNQLRLNACMLAPAPPQSDSPKVGEDYVLNGQSWLLMDYTYGLDHRYSCCDLIVV